MNEIIKSWKQQTWHPQYDVELRKGGIITLNGTPLQTEREQALAYIIMGLNAYVVLNEEKKKLQLQN